MTVPFDFLVGFTCCSMVVGLYLLYEMVGAVKALVEIMRECLEELREE